VALVRAGFRAAMIGSVVVVASCSLINSYDDLVGPPSTDAGADASDSPSDGELDASIPMDGEAGSTCPSARGPTMVTIPLGGGAHYCVDSTEVTQAQYQAFLDDIKLTPLPAALETRCETRDLNPNQAGTCMYDPKARGAYPVVCVTWCAASAYCRWAGKRLCGAVDGGPLEPALQQDTIASQWVRACSGAGTASYAYGVAFDAGACNVSGAGDATAPVASLPACEGAYKGLFDMVGNVLEWEDSCEDDAGPVIYCGARGASFREPADPTFGTCAHAHGVPYGFFGYDLGFRCCAP
jgi:formylglycine-generating enzyme required for sulfatase activity